MFLSKKFVHVYNTFWLLSALLLLTCQAPASPLLPYKSLPHIHDWLFNVSQSLTWALSGTMAGSLVSPQLVTVSRPLSQNLFIARTFSQNTINSSVSNGRPHGLQPHPSWLLGGLSFRGHSADTEFTIAWPPAAQNMTFYSLSLLGLESFLLHLLKQPPSLKSVVWMSC